MHELKPGEVFALIRFYGSGGDEVTLYTDVDDANADIIEYCEEHQPETVEAARDTLVASESRLYGSGFRAALVDSLESTWEFGSFDSRWDLQVCKLPQH